MHIQVNCYGQQERGVLRTCLNEKSKVFSCFRKLPKYLYLYYKYIILYVMFIVLPEEIPQEVLKCKAVAREIIFSSAEEVRGFRYIAGLLICSIVVLFYCAVVLLCGTIVPVCSDLWY